MKINNIPDEQLESQLKYLKLLSKQYPSIAAASTEIINLEAILNPYYNLRDDEEICFNIVTFKFLIEFYIILVLYRSYRIFLFKYFIKIAFIIIS